MLDFGCGSLPESFELSSCGFRVTAFDLDGDTLNAYLTKYDWTDPKPQLVSSGSLSQFSGKGFSLAIAVDVFEHLDRPTIALDHLSSALTTGGLIFCTVPNGYSLFELGRRVVLGHTFTPSVPHFNLNLLVDGSAASNYQVLK